MHGRTGGFAFGEFVAAGRAARDDLVLDEHFDFVLRRVGGTGHGDHAVLRHTLRLLLGVFLKDALRVDLLKAFRRVGIVLEEDGQKKIGRGLEPEVKSEKE